jgi:hypothetical protein
MKARLARQLVAEQLGIDEQTVRRRERAYWQKSRAGRAESDVPARLVRARR